LVHAKPTVWTLHDPWALTGHCVHPVDCKGWLTGCKKCPHLDRYSPLKEDNSNNIWNMKKEVYKDIDIDIVVASKWMLDLVRRSPLTKHFKRVHLIPFGIDLKLFKQRKNREKIRKGFGIEKDDFVIMFRQDDQEWKGLPYIKKMLDKLDVDRHIVILTVGETRLLDEYKKRYKIIEYEWIRDDNLMVDLYSAADIFLMPSVAESFGMMAIESMACSLPLIVCEGTALPSVTFAPECGIAIKQGNPELFASAVNRLISMPEERAQRGRKGRELAEKHYDVSVYNKSMINLYKDIYSRNQKRKKSKI